MCFAGKGKLMKLPVRKFETYEIFVPRSETNALFRLTFPFLI